MKNGLCPKCNSYAVYLGVSAEGEGLTAGSYIPLIEVAAGKDQTTLGVDTYVCRVCGYLELYIANSTDLNVLPEADGWVKVPCAEAHAEDHGG